MPTWWTEERAWRWSLIAMLVGFLGGSAIGLVLVGYVAIHWGFPERGWWVVPTALQWGFLAVLFGGGGSAIAATKTVERAAYLTGTSLCWRCGRPRRWTSTCPCVLAELGQEPSPPVWRRAWRWCRPHLPAVTVIFILAIPIAALDVWYISHHRKLGHLAGELAFAHFAVCLAFFLAVEGADIALEWFKTGERFRRTWRPRARLMAIYLIAFAIAGACRATR